MTMQSTPTHPDVVVKLIGQDSNVFNLLAICTRALKRAGHDDDATALAATVFRSASFDEALAHMASMVAVR